jgi:hypothetical protein
MVSAISAALQSQAVAKYTATSTPKPAQAEPKPPANADSVQISQAAKAKLAAMEEAHRPSAQAAKKSEAAGHKS